MPTQALIVAALAFVSVLLAGLGLRYVVLSRRDHLVQGRLVAFTQEPDPDLRHAILRDLKLSGVPALDRMFQGMPLVRRVQTLLLQADVRMRAGPFSLLVLTLALVGAYACLYIFHRPLLVAPSALVPAVIPVLIIYRKKQKRLRLFEERLPDALDLMTGALRSGMAFTGALQVVAQESPPPISDEFTIIFEEHRLGLDLGESLRNMTRRVDSRELRIFVTAVLLQRETGGNLAEILEGTADIIRDRFRILGEVRTLTAPARMTGLVLAILPLVMAGVLLFVAPDYLTVLVHDPAGSILISVAVVLQLLGFLVIRRIIAIKV
jgi:tight adherence protein B